MERIIKIREELKCPKNQYNSFGKYSYRSCEDILEAVKPLLTKYELSLTISDDIVQVGERYYVKATCRIHDKEGKEIISNTAYAREEEEKKGQDGSQITGTSSSYARKYCLNGLFLIDDTKDADTDEYTKETNKETKSKKEVKVEPITQDQIKLIHTLINGNEELHQKTINHYGVDSVKDMSKAQANECITILKKGLGK